MTRSSGVRIPYPPALRNLVYRLYARRVEGRLDHTQVERWSASSGAILLCGRYEGIDQRFIDAHVDFTKAPDNGPSGNIALMPGNVGARRRDNQYTLHTAQQTVDPGVDSLFPAGYLLINMGDKSDSFIIP